MLSSGATYKNVTIFSLSHAGFLVKYTDGLVIAIDPYEYRGDQKAKIIFVTHKHFDHCDLSSINKLSEINTIVVAPSSCKSELEAAKAKLIFCDEADLPKKLEIDVDTIPAYNTNKFRNSQEVFHPQSLGGVGYIISHGGVTIYHAGDTDETEEMQSLKNKIDIAFLPVSGTYVMTAAEAAEAAKTIQPKLVIPMHYGKIVGTSNDAMQLKNLLSGNIPVTVI